MNYKDIPGIIELEEEYAELIKEYDLKKCKVVTKYVNKNTKFKKGDFVYCVLGVIKIENVKWSSFFEDIQISYEGPKYRRDKGKLIRTKSVPRDEFIDYGNIIKLNISEWKI